MDETFEEWRVTGEPGRGYPAFDFVWSPDRNAHLGNPENAARAFVRLITLHEGWEDGPHLTMRTVTRTEWKAEAA